jgi:hypothetical protein
MRGIFCRSALGFALLAMWLRPALADTVNAGAKPYLVGGGWITGFFLSALGLFNIWKGVHYRSVAHNTAGWPTAQATVIASAVLERVFRDAQNYSARRYIPEVRYVYEVDGTQRENDVIQMGLGDLGYMIEKQALEHAARYPVHARVSVWYDPANPTFAVLEAGQVSGINKIVAGVLYLVLGLGAFVFAIWTGALDGR